VSNYGVHHLKELATVSRITPAVNQIELHPFLQRPDIVAYCEAQGMQLVAYSPLAKGLRMLDPRLMSIAAKHGATTANVMLRWALQRGFCIIPKSSKPARMTENASVVGEGALMLGDEEMTLLDSAEEGLVTGWDPVTGP
jgi:diketogulonate reductase-like aldo/keto reductase